MTENGARRTTAAADTGPARDGCDVLVVGGGIVGLTAALELKRRRPDRSVILLEKEPACGLHASGRNSGVVHAGLYYPEGSLKARLVRDGNREMVRYCEARRLPVERCGKLVVARDETELDGLDELQRRAAANGVEVHPVDERQARMLEPRARTFGRALYSPTTGSLDPRAVVASLVGDARAAGVEVRTGTGYVGRTIGGVRTSRGVLRADFVLNAAGLHADRIAHDFGFGRNVRILPFRGLYLVAPEAERLRMHIYPVPDLRFPFLGVHFTRTVGGRVKIGPTALPAPWREAYGGFENFRLDECLDVVRRQTRLFLRDTFGFRRLAVHELGKRSRRRLLGLAAELSDRRPSPEGWTWGPPGIRAQLLNTRTGRLEMDFHMEGDRSSLHVLNAVSPAFTCAFPFARLVADEVERSLEGAGPGSVARRSTVAPAGTETTHVPR